MNQQWIDNQKQINSGTYTVNSIDQINEFIAGICKEFRFNIIKYGGGNFILGRPDWNKQAIIIYCTPNAVKIEVVDKRVNFKSEPVILNWDAFIYNGGTKGRKNIEHLLNNYIKRFAIIGRIMNGAKVEQYVVEECNGHTFPVPKEVLMDRVALGNEFINAKIRVLPNGQKVLSSINGCNLLQLPVMKM